MIYLYLLLTMAVTLGCCALSYRFFGEKIRQYEIKLDDGKGYFLISVIMIAFFGASAAYFVGSLLGFDRDPELQGRLVAAILLNTVVALLSLTYGLLHFKEGEKYR